MHEHEHEQLDKTSLATKALHGLRTLREELAENSGTDNPFSPWMQNVFGKWKNLALSIFTSLCVVAAILITCGCCLIPCLRALIQRLIDTALSRPQQPEYLLIPQTEDSDVDLTNTPDGDDYDDAELQIQLLFQDYTEL